MADEILLSHRALSWLEDEMAARKVGEMVNRKYIAGLVMFSMLTLAGLIVWVVSRTAALRESNATLDVTLTSSPFGSLIPTDNMAPGTPGADSTTQTSNRIFYVSKEGNNSDGKSWATAWKELDQIHWEEVEPGDTIMIRGGEYHTNMNVEANGLSGLPITITTDGEQVILNGQLPAPPYCGQSGFIPQAGADAINLEGQSFIVIDGKDWSGIVIRNHKRGIMMRRGASNIIVRNLEIYDNGWSVGSGSNTAPDGAGVELGGSQVLFERVIIHDNGQDAFQAGWGVWNFTLRNSWLYNSREHPSLRGKSFNYCSHTDAIQIYDGGLQGPMMVEKSIIGPSFTQAIMINKKAEVNNVLFKDTLFVGNDNSAINIQKDGESSNWTLQNITIVQDATRESWNLKLDGHGHQIRDSIFAGGPWGIGIFDWSEAIRNYSWLTRDQYDVAVDMDPMFADDDTSFFQGEDFADFDYTIQNPAIPPGTGSSITSVTKLLEQ